MPAGNEAVETDIDLETGEIIEKPPLGVVEGEQKTEPATTQSVDRGMPSVADNNKKFNWKGGLFFVPVLIVALYWVFKDEQPAEPTAEEASVGAPAGFSQQYQSRSRDIVQEWLAKNPPKDPVVGPPTLPEPKDTAQQTSGNLKAPAVNKGNSTPVQQQTSQAATTNQPNAPRGMVSRDQLYQMASQPMRGGSSGSSAGAGGGGFGSPAQNPYAPANTGDIEKALMGALTPKAPDQRDSNLQFRDRVSNQKVEKVQARQLTDMEYLVLQGTFIHVTLDTAIDSTLPGEVRGTVAKNVYGVSGSRVLIPRGSTLFGVHNSDIRRGQGRVFVVWTRLLTPQGYDIPIGSSGGDNLGRAGFGGEVDHHFWQRFGNATLLSLLGATLSNAGVDGNDQPNSANTYREALSMSFQSSSSRSLEENIDIEDTIYKDQGEPVIVFVNRDLDFSSVLKK